MTLQTGAELLPGTSSTICSCFRVKARLNVFFLSHTISGLIAEHLPHSVKDGRELIPLTPG